MTASIETPSGKNAGTENFPVGSVLIRADLRPHVHAFYGFARAADDIADNPLLEPAEKVRRLDRMAEILLGSAVPADDAASPSAARLRASLAESGVAPTHSLDVLVAFRRDATQLRYGSWDDLMDYCRYSANPVGRQLLDLHGEGPASHAPSDALCSALQVLNHLQDCVDDYRALDRVYLPAALLAECGGTIGDLAEPAATPGLRRTIDRLLDLTDALIETAAALPGAVRDRRLRAESAAIVTLARRLSALLRRQDPVAGRVKLGRFDFAAAASAGLCAAFRPGLAA